MDEERREVGYRVVLHDLVSLLNEALHRISHGHAYSTQNTNTLDFFARVFRDQQFIDGVDATWIVGRW